MIGSYEHALKRLRGLVLAQNALDEAVEVATQDVLDAATEEAVATGAKHISDPPPLHRSHDNLAVFALPERRQSPVESGVQPKLNPTRTMTRKIGSADVERYIGELWAKAKDEKGRVHVRDVIYQSIESGVLDADARERILKLTAA